MFEILQRTRSCMVVEGPDRLHIFTPRGRNTVNAKGIAQIHTLMEAHLGQTIIESEITSGLSEDVGRTVRRYLETLVEAGALCPPGDLEESNVSTPVNERPDLGHLANGETHMELSLNGLRACITIGRVCDLDHAIPPDFRLSCVDEQSLLPVFSSYGNTAAPEAVVVVTMDSQLITEDIQLQCIEWLSLLAADNTNLKSQFVIYRFDCESKELTRLFATAAGKPWSRLEISDALSLVRPANCDQLPLAVACAGWGTRPATSPMYSLRYDQVFRDVLLATLLVDVQFSCPEEDTAAPLSANSRSYGGNGSIRSTSSYIPLLALLLEQYLGQAHVTQGGAPCDLLTEMSSDPDILYLQKALRMRESVAHAVLTHSDVGLFAYESDHGRFTSLIREKALRDALLTTVFHSYYPGMADRSVNALGSEYSPYADSTQLQQAIDASVASLHRGVSDFSFNIQHRAVFGLDTWVGILS
jgi:hypothetical protein